MAGKQPQIETGESAKREMSLAQNVLAFALATLMAGGAGALHGVLIRPSDAPVATNPPGGPSDDRKFAALAGFPHPRPCVFAPDPVSLLASRA